MLATEAGAVIAEKLHGIYFIILAISLIYLEMRISWIILSVNELFYYRLSPYFLFILHFRTSDKLPDVRNKRRVNAYFTEYILNCAFVHKSHMSQDSFKH
jgi:hypothetical protein